MDGAEKRTISRFRDGARNREEDSIARETQLLVLANGKELFGLYCTPSMVRELVVGFVMTENIFEKGAFCAERMSISYGEDMITVDIPVEEGGHAGNKAKRRAIITSGCAGGITFEKSEGAEPIKGGPAVPAGVLTLIFAKFLQASALHRETGCVHSACLTDGENILCLAEDIGRHNAVDKIIGWALLEGFFSSLSDKILLSSGRLSSEIVSRCAAWGIPVLVSRSAPTCRAIDIAERAGITLVGFLRGKNFNVYTHPERIG